MIKGYYVIEFGGDRKVTRIAGESAKKSPTNNGPYRKPTQVDG